MYQFNRLLHSYMLFKIIKYLTCLLCIKKSLLSDVLNSLNLLFQTCTFQFSPAHDLIVFILQKYYSDF